MISAGIKREFRKSRRQFLRSLYRTMSASSTLSIIDDVEYVELRDDASGGRCVKLWLRSTSGGRGLVHSEGGGMMKGM